jgi:death-on-curing protein
VKKKPAWTWIDKAVLLAVHEEQLAEHGGASGTRDMGLFESAIARPQRLAHCGESDAADLAAAYAVGLSRNPPFVDGNKRTAFVAAELFLNLNGLDLHADDAACVWTMLAVAAGQMDEATLARWLREHSAPR